MKKAFLLISAGMLGYLGPGSMAVASEVPSELPEPPITTPASGSSSRSTSNSAGTTINQQTNSQENNDQFHGFGLGIRCPTPTLGFSLYGGGGAGGSGPEGGVSTAAYGGMITLNLPLGNRNRQTCAELGEAQLRAVQAQTERAQLEAAKVRTDINLVTLQQCITILQTARLSGRFADACAGVELGAQGQTPRFSDRSQPGEGETGVALAPPPAPPPPPVARPTAIDPAAAATPDFPLASAPEGEYPVIAPPPPVQASLPSIARVSPIAPGPARSPVAPAPPPETSVSRGTELPAIARIPAHRPHPAATVSSPETTEGVAFARDGGPWSGR